MNGKIPPLTSDTVIKILLQAGFHFDRQKGSHCFFRHPDGRKTTVAKHSGEKISRGMLRKIMFTDAGLTRKEFFRLWKK